MEIPRSDPYRARNSLWHSCCNRIADDHRHAALGGVRDRLGWGRSLAGRDATL